MSCPHFSIAIRQRSKRQSAVAGAAYQSGEKLFSEYDGKTKNYRYKSGEVLAKGILLPKQARPEYADRQTLWNAVEKAEGQWNAQLARGVILALPNEIPKEAYEPLVRDYCLEQFVSRGMAADFAIHDKGDGNPHAHILLTMRAMDENGNWLPKARKVYDLDDTGKRIRLPSGEWKSHKENIVDWDSRENAELWRSKWAEAVNRCYEKYDIPIRLDLRSFARQGKEKVPTIHLGPAVSHLEEKGVRTELGEYNRQIKKHNANLREKKKLLASLRTWLASIAERLTALFEKEPKKPTLLDIVNGYFALRKDQRFDWSSYAKQKGTVVDLKQRAKIFNWMQETSITTLEDFQQMLEKVRPMLDTITANEKEIRKLENGIRYLDTYVRLKPVADKSKSGFQSARERYAAAHSEELEQFGKAVRFLKANHMNVSDRDRCAQQIASLREENTRLRADLAKAKIDPEMIRQIQYCVDTVLHEAELPEKKASVLAKLNRPEAQSRPTDNNREALSR